MTQVRYPIPCLPIYLFAFSFKHKPVMESTAPTLFNRSVIHIIWYMIVRSRTCQNSMRSGTTRIPPQCGGRGGSFPSNCFCNVSVSGHRTGSCLLKRHTITPMSTHCVPPPVSLGRLALHDLCPLHRSTFKNFGNVYQHLGLILHKTIATFPIFERYSKTLVCAKIFREKLSELFHEISTKYYIHCCFESKMYFQKKCYF